jgi:hypothetical protein
VEDCPSAEFFSAALTDMSRQEKRGWTLRGVLQATGFAIAGMMVAMQLQQWRLWPDGDWSFLLLPAIGASVFLAKRYPGTGLLTVFVFFPLLVMLMFYAVACLPLGPGGN